MNSVSLLESMVMDPTSQNRKRKYGEVGTDKRGAKLQRTEPTVISGFEKYFEDLRKNLEKSFLQIKDLKDSEKELLKRNFKVLADTKKETYGLRFSPKGEILSEESYRFIRAGRTFLPRWSGVSDDIDNLEVFTRFLKYYAEWQEGTTSTNELLDSLSKAILGLENLRDATIYGTNDEKKQKIEKNIARLKKIEEKIKRNTLAKDSRSKEKSDIGLFSNFVEMTKQPDMDVQKRNDLIRTLAANLKEANMIDQFDSLKQLFAESDLLNKNKFGVFACLLWDTRATSPREINQFCQTLKDQLKDYAGWPGLRITAEINLLRIKLPTFIEILTNEKADKEKLRLLKKEEKIKSTSGQEDLINSCYECVKSGGALSLACLLASYAPAVNMILPYFTNRTETDLENLCNEFLKIKFIEEHDQGVVRDALHTLLTLLNEEDSSIFAAITKILQEEKSKGIQVVKEMGELIEKIDSANDEKLV